MGLRKRRTRTDWLAAGEEQIRLRGHMSATVRPAILSLVLTGNGSQRARALDLLDAEKLVHPGYERLATRDEIDGQAVLSDLTRKLSTPGPALPPWPDAWKWRH